MIRLAYFVLFASFVVSTSSAYGEQLALDDIGKVCRGATEQSKDANGFICGTKEIELNGELTRLEFCDGTFTFVGPGGSIDDIPYDSYQECVATLAIALIEPAAQERPFDCRADGTQPTASNVEQFVYFHNRGVYFSGESEFENAVICFEEALKYFSDDVGALNDLALAYWGLNDLPNVREHLELATQTQLSRLKSFDATILNRPTYKLMSCADRNRFTKEAFTIAPWVNLARLTAIEEGGTTAGEVFDTFISNYPIESCWHTEAVGEAHYLRGQYRCNANDTDGARFDMLQAIDVGFFNKKRLISFQTALATGGYYDIDAIDGEMGPNTMSGMELWIDSNCPILE